MERDADSTPFPWPVKWALVAAPFSLVALWVISNTYRGDVKIVLMVVFLTSGLCALLAVPAAVFLLASRPNYRNRTNFVMTLIAALPFAATMIVLLIYAIGATGGRIH